MSPAQITNVRNAPLPAIFLETARPKVEALALAVGAVYATKLQNEIEKLDRGQQTGAISEFDVRHAGRVLKFMVATTRPWVVAPLKALLRLVVVSVEEGNMDDSVIKLAMDQARKAALDRDLQGGDATIRALGSPDGFDITVRTPDGKPY